MPEWLTVAGAAVLLITGLVGLAVAGVRFIVTVNDALDAIQAATRANRETTNSLTQLHRRVRRLEHHLGFKPDRRAGADRRVNLTRENG